MKTDEELLDEFIAQEFPVGVYIITEEERAIIAKTDMFRAFCLSKAWDEFKEAVKGEFRCSRIYYLLTKVLEKFS